MCFEINRVQLVHRGVQRGRCSRAKRFSVQRPQDGGFTGLFDSLQIVVRTRDRKFVCENHKKILVGCGFAMWSMRPALLKQTTSMRKKAEGSQAPSRSYSKDQHECTPDYVIRSCSFAPALEHTYDSNREQQDGADCKRFDKHWTTPVLVGRD